MEKQTQHTIRKKNVNLASLQLQSVSILQPFSWRGFESGLENVKSEKS